MDNFTHTPSWYPQSGIGPSQFSRKQLFAVIKMRARAGKKLRKNIKTYKNATKSTLMKEAKRVKGSGSWASFYFKPSIQRLFGK